jgi:hypothetical protein
MSIRAVAPLDAVRAALPALTNMFSPSRNPCVVRAGGPGLYRFDPYRAKVVESPTVFTPAAKSPLQALQTTTQPAVRRFFCEPIESMMPPLATAQQSPAPQPLCAPLPLTTPYAYFPPQAPLPLATHASARMTLECPCASCCVSMTSTPVPSVPASVVPSAIPSRSQSPIPSVSLAAGAPTRATSAAESIAEASECSADEAGSNKTHYAIVRFKHDSYPYLAPFRVSVGDYVIVSGDRGENMGVVKSITTDKPRRPVGSKVLRKASPAEVAHLHALREKEANAVAVCRKAVKELALNMVIVDTEYQLDASKLTIFFDSKVSVDFRRLQRVLFREFRCRVWIVNWKGELPENLVQ